MNDIKISLTVTIPGRIMMSEKDCSLNRKNNYTQQSVIITDKRNKSKETIRFYTRNCIPAKQSLQITEDNYKEMVNKNNRPSWFSGNKNWKKMSNWEKVDAHMKKICENLNGLSYEFVIFDS